MDFVLLMIYQKTIYYETATRKLRNAITSDE